MYSPTASACTSVLSHGATQSAARSAPSAAQNPKRRNSLAMEVRVDLSQTGLNDGDALDQPLSIMDCLGLLSCRALRTEVASLRESRATAGVTITGVHKVAAAALGLITLALVALVGYLWRR